MIWQDIVLSLGTIVFVLALIPTVLHDHKPHLTTSMLTGLTVMIFAYTYVTLDLIYSAAAAFVNGSLWLVLAYQKYRQAK